MLRIEKNISLKNFNTFGIDVKAENFVEIRTENDLKELFESAKLNKTQKLVLGSGSNILFVDDVSGLVIHNNIKGITVKEINENDVVLTAGAGEIWDEIVEYAVINNYGGIENLSLIPGSVGAAPIQNIGAYGVELKDVFHTLEGYFIHNSGKRKFTLEECKFSYRDSIFKNELKNKFIITKVSLLLTKNWRPNLSYSSLSYSFNGEESDIRIDDVRQKVIEIRKSKLPDPEKINNAGSFFKNPEVNEKQLQKLLNKYPDLVYYSLDSGFYKLSAGWLIEKCGLKGVREGNVGTYEKQALVIVNYGAKSGKEILKFAKLIQTEVMNKFGIKLETEVNIIKQK